MTDLELKGAFAAVDTGSGTAGHTDHLGDPLPEGAVQRLGTRRMQYSISDMAYSADGEKAFVMSGEKVHVWDLIRGEQLGAYRVSDHSLAAMDCDQSVRKALFADRSGTVIEWDLEENREVHRFATGRESLISVRYSPDGERVLTLDRDASAVEEWNKETGERLILAEASGESLNRCIYGPDGRTAFVGHQPGDNVYHYDLATGELLKIFVDDYSNYDMCLSADGERLLVGTRHKSNEWRLSDYACLETFTGHLGHAVSSVAYTRDDRYLLTGSRDGSIRLWDRKKAEVVRRWYPHQGHVNRMRVSPDGAWVLSYGAGLLAETSLETGEPRLQWERHMASVQALAFSPDGTRAVSGSADKTIRIWEADGWRPVQKISDPGDEVHALSISPDGRHFAAGLKNGAVRVFTSETGEVVRTLEGHLGYVRAVAYVGDRLLSGAGDGSVRLWDVERGETIRTMEGHQGGVLAVAPSPDGTRALSGGRDGTVREWDLETGELLQTAVAHRGWVQAVAYSPDGGAAISAGRDGLMVEWDLAEGREERVFDHGAWVEDARFTGGGQRVCSGGQDGDVVVWDRATGEEVRRFSGHDAAVHALAESPDGRALLSGSGDNTVLVWRLA